MSGETKAELVEPQIADEGEITYPEGGRKAYSVVFAAWLGFICDFGLLNSLGAIESYIEDHILLDNTSSEIAWIFSLYGFLSFSGNLFSGFMFDRYGARMLTAMGSVFLVGGLFATANCTQLWQFVLAFGFCVGLASALLMSPIVNCCSHFFNKKRGLAVGLAMSGASIGGVVWPLVCRSLYGKVGFSWTIRILAFIFLFLLAVTCLMVDDRRHELAKKDSPESSISGTAKIMSIVRGIVDFSMLKDVTYDLLVVALFFNEFSVLLTFTYVPEYATNKGFSHSTGLLALTILNAVGVPGRYIPSMLADKVGNFNTMCIVSFAMSLSLLVVWTPFGQHLSAFFVFIAIYGFFCAGSLSLTPLCTAAISEPQNYGKAYGTAYFFAAFASLISLPIGMSIVGTDAGYQGMAAFCGATCFIATIFFVLTRLKLGGVRMATV